MIRITLLAITILIHLTCYGQIDRWSVETSLDKFNLKGSVKEISVGFERYYPYEELPRKVISEYEFRNFWEVRNFPMGKWSFDQLGYIQSKQSRYKDDTLVSDAINFRMNKTWVTQYEQQKVNQELKLYGKTKNNSFPAFNPYSIEINHIIYMEGDRDTLKLSYKYSFEQGSEKITEKLSFESNRLSERASFVYDQMGKILSIKVHYNENAPERARPLMTSSMDIGRTYNIFLSDVMEANYSFDYDSLNRINKATLLIKDGKLWEEEYSYKGNSYAPYKVDRFIVSGYTYRKFLTDNEIEWYNSYGDPTRTENYDDQGNLVKTRFYDYVYDDHNNWIQCDMYLEGGEERTEKPTIIIYRDFEYYTEQEVKEAWEQLEEIKN